MFLLLKNYLSAIFNPIGYPPNGVALLKTVFL